MNKRRKQIIESYEVSKLVTYNLGGYEQKVLIEGKSRKAPVMISLHGGPGSPIPFSEGCRGMFPEITDSVIMVYWDQLGCGINNYVIDNSFCIDDFVAMTVDLIREIKKEFSDNGTDDIEYEISTNPGEDVKPLGRIVSGGELSRIMLAIKAILADRDQIETLIFDEIDTGISGRTAQKVSEKMAVIGACHQVLCITHLPQIAAMADTHFEIEKHQKGTETITEIHPLEGDAAIRELARLLGGAEITEAVFHNAKEMKELAQVHKNTRLK